MSIFDLSILYTKIPHDKLLYVSNEITDFTFKGGTRDCYCLYFRSILVNGPKVKLEEEKVKPSPRNKILFSRF